MSLTTCESFKKEFLTEADPYVVLPKPSETILVCLKCATSATHRAGWEQCKSEATQKCLRMATNVTNSDLTRHVAAILSDAIAAMEYKGAYE